jgi:hypothetical protein
VKFHPQTKHFVGAWFLGGNKKEFSSFFGLGKGVMHAHIDILWFIEFCGIW